VVPLERLLRHPPPGACPFFPLFSPFFFKKTLGARSAEQKSPGFRFFQGIYHFPGIFPKKSRTERFMLFYFSPGFLKFMPKIYPASTQNNFGKRKFIGR
jgi:hypothetical protein